MTLPRISLPIFILIVSSLFSCFRMHGASVEDKEVAPVRMTLNDSLPAELHVTAPTPEPILDLTPIANGYIRNNNWLYLLRTHQLNLADPNVEYPKFLGFCVKVYNWADKFFNGYDPQYVQGTGHRWKARISSDNWFDAYSMKLRDKARIRMLGSLYSNLGAYLHYMAVSVGYSIDLNTVFGGKSTDHSKFETNFNCARFNLDLSYNVNNGGTYVRQLKGYNSDRLLKYYFPGVDMSTLNINLYYFLNHTRYSQGAAYNFSKIQKKSQGSWIVGLTYANLDIKMDFSTFPDALRPYLDVGEMLRLHYNDYNILFGYGYNWVFHPKFLFNITVMPSIGFNHCYGDSYDGSATLLSLNAHGRMSLTYNHSQFFASFIGKVNGKWYLSKSLSLLNAIEIFSFNAGFRF